MVSWDEFARWLKAHDLPFDTVLRIELVPVAGGYVYLRAKALKLNESGRPIARQIHDDEDQQTPISLTEVLVRPLVYLPGEQPPEPTE